MEKGDMHEALTRISSILYPRLQNVMKFGSSVLFPTEKSFPSNMCEQKFRPVIITPNSIPEFIIPKLYGGEYSTNREAKGNSDDLYQNKQDNTLCDISLPEGVTKDKLKRPSSVPLQPLRGPSNRNKFRRHAISYEMIDDRNKVSSNADPRSTTAMSIKHLKMMTRFGFETLSECPGTKRKESLFHDQDSSEMLCRTLTRTARMQSKLYRPNPTLTPAIDDDDSPEQGFRKSSKRRTSVAELVMPLGILISSKGMDTSSPSLCNNNQPMPPSKPHTKSLERSSVYSTSDTISLDDEIIIPSPSLNKKLSEKRYSSSYSVESLNLQDPMKDENENTSYKGGRRFGGCMLALAEEDMQQLWRVSALTNTVELTNSYPDSDQYFQSSLNLFSSLNPYTKGQLKFNLCYSYDKRQLDLNLIQGIDLSKDHTSVNAFVNICLCTSHGTKQTQNSNVVKATQNPIFNQVFVFGDISPGDLRNQRLQMKVFNREGILPRLQLLGEVHLILNELDFNVNPNQELVRSLEMENIPKELGRLQSKICFHANRETLVVTLLNVKDLPRTAFMGSPDPYVLLKLQQPDRPDIRLMSKVKRNVTSATINETFSFHISPRIEDLNYTSLSLVIHSRSMIRADKFLGEVRLGFSATERSEFEHWNNVLSCPGKEVTCWHMLMEEQ